MMGLAGKTRWGILGSLAVGQILLAGVPSWANASTLSTEQIEGAAQSMCKTLQAGQSPEAAKEAAITYLLDQGVDKGALNAKTLQQQIRPVVIKQCPGQARKLKTLAP